MPLIIDILRESSLKHAQKTAIRCKVAGRWIDFTYETVWQTSDRIAAGLAEWGLVAGDRAAILGSSSPSWVMAYLGILKSNAIAVPIDKELKTGELRHILKDSKTRILFAEKSFSDAISDMGDEELPLEKIVLLNHLPTGSPGQSHQIERALATLVNEWQNLTQKYNINDDDVHKFENMAESFQEILLPGTTKQIEEEKGLFKRLLRFEKEKKSSVFDIELLDMFQKPSPPPILTAQPNDPAVILYTSGTTGRSKGAMLSHANICSNVIAAKELYNLTPDMHTLSFLPINHVFEQVGGIILPLAAGGTISFAESLRRLGENLAEVKPNFLLGVPAVFRLLADRMSRKIEDNRLLTLLFKLKPTKPLVTKKIRDAFGGSPVFISGGAALDPLVASKLMSLGLNIYQGYGITETSPVIAVETPECHRLGTVGRPLPGVEVKIHQPNAEGVGEIWVKGPNVMLGYYNNQKATDEAITEGWYHTGDLGCLEEDGLLRICGRVKNLIVTANGKNVYPEEVENELLNSPYISEIMVYGHKVSDHSEEAYAMIYPDHDALDQYANENNLSPLSPQDIENVIRNEVLEHSKNLADYKRIKRFTLREDEFPKTTTRKIKRFVVEADIDTNKSENTGKGG